MKFIKNILKYIVEFVYIKILYLFPIKKNKIIFCNFVGRGYGGNPKYIAEHLRENYSGLNMYWLCRNKNEKFPDNVKPIKIYRIKHFYHVMTAKFIINNTRCPMKVPKRKGQIYLQTWHASFGAKKVEQEAEANLTEQYIKEAKEEGKICDAILSSCKQMTNQIKRCFWLNGKAEILEYGIPRNDYLIKNSNNNELILNIKENLGIKKDVFLVLYAPTFRDDNSIKGYKLDFDGLYNAFKKTFNKEIKILLRCHPNVTRLAKIFPNEKYILNVSEYADMQHLLIISDFIITDYSSVGFDGMIMNKPVLAIALDLKEYEKTRGLVDEFYSFPYPLAHTNEEAISAILKFDINDYTKKINNYKEKYPLFDDGNASEKVCKWIMNKIN